MQACVCNNIVTISAHITIHTVCSTIYTVYGDMFTDYNVVEIQNEGLSHLCFIRCTLSLQRKEKHHSQTNPRPYHSHFGSTPTSHALCM